MEEKVGWRRAFSAAIVLGLYSGFMITIGILSSIGTEYFVEAFVTWGSSNHIIGDYTHANISKWQEKRS